MIDSYTRAVLDRAQSLREAELSAQALMRQDRAARLRAGLAAALAALMALYPTVSAAAML